MELENQKEFGVEAIENVAIICKKYNKSEMNVYLHSDIVKNLINSFPDGGIPNSILVSQVLFHLIVI